MALELRLESRTEREPPPRGAFVNRVYEGIPRLWAWHSRWWKPKDRRCNLVRAGALIVAEIERLDRAAALGTKTEGE